MVLGRNWTLNRELKKRKKTSPVSEKTRHPSKSPAPYEEIDKDLNLSGGSAPPGVYDKAYPTPSGDDPSANAYSTIDGPANTYTAPKGPTEDYSELSHPAKAITKPKFDSNYSKLNEHTAEELPTYDVSIHGHPQTQPQTLPPHVAALYDTANYPNEPTCHMIMLKQQISLDVLQCPLQWTPGSEQYIHEHNA